MQELCLTIRVLTPMFLAGADGKTAELRAASIKGMLRFWWRAQNGSMSLEKLKKKEGEIFGTAGEGDGRKSRFSLAVEETGVKVTQDPLPLHKEIVTRSNGRSFPVNLLEYLAYGTYEWDRAQKRNILVRQYIAPDSTFRLVVRLWDEGKNGKIPGELVKALRAFCLFGTLGTKARNGYGSFKVEKVEGPEKMKQELAAMVPGREIMENLCTFDGLPSFSAFCKGAGLFRTKSTYKSWDGCLAELARAYREARLSLEKRHEYGKRQYLGAPIVANQKQESLLDRHAKPYFLRVHEEEGGYAGYILYLPSQYLPPVYHQRLGINREKFPAMDDEREGHDRNFLAVCRDMNEKFAKKLEVVFWERF
ncbi:type III-B CRISPR module RAMP protein Cmr1 [Desulfofundulus sp. TPOSR]|uniref:type III-B CRISPR module RAMP protein Cmr1 n=1 Tax=Desulfofundulus sp. TPOSR TaxID=2714340 RepID=UPI001407A4EE|nr:type III-B CRISPR module RAMP protein Cmr1 [Desulfofundulus sp. TPOSR]NHM27874.1 type III-B CRISPR module RAMP protein Cmr1 [Desulfofundulus sp. TPOSR]